LMLTNRKSPHPVCVFIQRLKINNFPLPPRMRGPRAKGTSLTVGPRFRGDGGKIEFADGTKL
jgi:hypothetical protein